MRKGPPKFLEWVVGLLIPPVCREPVLGDFHERYRGIQLYIYEALRVVPAVIFSRIRRTTDPQVLLMEAFSLYLSLVGAAWALYRPFLDEETGFLRLAIPTAVALAALVLKDAYARPGKRSLLNPIREAVLGVAFAFLSQAPLIAARTEFVVPLRIMIFGGCLSMLLVSTLRMLFPMDDNRPRGAT